MTFIELLTISVALSMDAFAVSVACGISSLRLPLVNGIIVALFFGGFQAGMPLIGWAAGEIAYSAIKDFDHWVAFTLLTVIGLKMIYDALGLGAKGKEEGDTENKSKCFADPMNYVSLTALAVATSLDALAVGVSFSCVSISIIPACATIGVTTFVFSLFGIKFGRKIGGKLGQKFGAAGGIALILIGVKIAMEG